MQCSSPSRHGHSPRHPPFTTPLLSLFLSSLLLSFFFLPPLLLPFYPFHSQIYPFHASLELLIAIFFGASPKVPRDFHCHLPRPQFSSVAPARIVSHYSHFTLRFISSTTFRYFQPSRRPLRTERVLSKLLPLLARSLFSLTQSFRSY